MSIAYIIVNECKLFHFHCEEKEKGGEGERERDML